MVDAQKVRAATLEHRAILGGPTVVHLNPTDVQALSERDLQVITAGGGITITPDVAVPPGGYSVGRGNG